MTTPCWTYSAGENAGEPVVWSELIAKLHGWRIPRGDDLRWCPHGAEHEMAVSLAGHACERCGVAVLHVERPQVVVLGEVYARTRGPRPCRKCG
jgi:hypothetical protein